jgi:hypothetical protein
MKILCHYFASAFCVVRNKVFGTQVDENAVVAAGYDERERQRASSNRNQMRPRVMPKVAFQLERTHELNHKRQITILSKAERWELAKYLSLSKNRARGRANSARARAARAALPRVPTDHELLVHEEAAHQAAMDRMQLARNSAPVIVAPDLCIVCMESTAIVTCMPCRHKNLCQACSDVIETKSRKCPNCRSAVTTFLVPFQAGIS